MPRRQRTELSPVLRLARPKQRRRLHVKIIQGMAIIRGEGGLIALVPEHELCVLAERLNIEYEGYKC